MNAGGACASELPSDIELRRTQGPDRQDLPKGGRVQHRIDGRIVDEVQYVRRAKLYYIRELRGKAARIREVKEGKEAKSAAQ